MKKWIVFILAAAVAVGVGGTAFADNTANLTDGTITMRAGKGAVIMQDSGGTGTSAYVATGYLQYNFDTAATNNGVSVFAIDTSRTVTAGTLQWTELTAAMRAYLSGATLIGAPVVATEWAGTPTSGDTGTSVYFLVAAGQDQQVSSFTTNMSDANTGLSLFCLDGANGTIRWQRGIPVWGMPQSAAADGGTSVFMSTPVTIDTESVAGSGATLYGAVGVLNNPSGAIGGASVYAIDADTGAIADNLTATTVFPTNTASESSGVSGFFAAPVISGNSLFVIGWHNGTTTGITMYAFDKNNLLSGVSAMGKIMPNSVDILHAQTPTPVVSGSSIYIVAAGSGTVAGVSVYDLDTLANASALNGPMYTVPYGPVAAGSGVSASPVTNGNYIVLCTTTAVSCYQLNNLSANIAQWTLDLAVAYTDGTYQIWGTPAISNGYVYIPVADSTGANKGFVLRCQLSDTTNGAPIKIGNITKMVVADLIVSGNQVWAATYNPTVYRIDNTGARGYTNWAQFKFDAAKTGHNTRPEGGHLQGSSGGCFISTIK